MISFTSARQAELLHLLGLPVPPPYPASLRDEALPAWLVPELLFGDYALARLERWTAAGKPDTPPGEVGVIGDDLLVTAARRVLACLPPPVRHHLSLHATLRVAGHVTGGHATYRSPPRAGAAEWPRDLTVVWRPVYQRCPLRRWRVGRRMMAHLGYGWLPEPDDPMAVFESCVAHEIGHAWLGRAYPTSDVDRPVAVEAIEREREERELLVRLGAEWGLLARLAEGPAREERLVSRLVARWGYSGAAADCWRQGIAAQQRVLSEAVALAAVDQ